MKQRSIIVYILLIWLTSCKDAKKGSSTNDDHVEINKEMFKQEDLDTTGLSRLKKMAWASYGEARRENPNIGSMPKPLSVTPKLLQSYKEVVEKVYLIETNKNLDSGSAEMMFENLHGKYSDSEVRSLPLDKYWLDKSLPQSYDTIVYWGPDNKRPIMGDPWSACNERIGPIDVPFVRRIPFEHESDTPIIGISQIHFNEKYSQAVVMLISYRRQPFNKASIYCLKKNDNHWQLDYEHFITHF